MLVKADHGYFRAVLRLAQTCENLAEGHATAYAGQQAVTFESDFVPLYPLGTPMIIERMYRGAVIHRFFGKVYLSDKKLMRIVSVEDELLPGAELFYCDGKSFHGTLTPCGPDAAPAPKLLRWPLAKLPAAVGPLQVRIIELTDRELVFLYDIHKELQAGQRFILEAEPPVPLHAVLTEIVKPFYFGQNACYVCTMPEISSRQAELLRAFLWDHTLKTRKLF